jgi:hypothetical protein
MEIHYVILALIFFAAIAVNIYLFIQRQKTRQDNFDACDNLQNVCKNVKDGVCEHTRLASVYNIDVKLILFLKIVDQDKVDQSFSTYEHLKETYLTEYEDYLEKVVMRNTPVGKEVDYMQDNWVLKQYVMTHLNRIGKAEGVEITAVDYELESTD